MNKDITKYINPADDKTIIITRAEDSGCSFEFLKINGLEGKIVDLANFDIVYSLRIIRLFLAIKPYWEENHKFNLLPITESLSLPELERVAFCEYIDSFSELPVLDERYLPDEKTLEKNEYIGRLERYIDSLFLPQQRKVRDILFWLQNLPHYGILDGSNINEKIEQLIKRVKHYYDQYNINKNPNEIKQLLNLSFSVIPEYKYKLATETYNMYLKILNDAFQSSIKQKTPFKLRLIKLFS